MGLDVSAVRAAYPALADGYASLDGAAGTQLPAPAASSPISMNARLSLDLPVRWNPYRWHPEAEMPGRAPLGFRQVSAWS